MWLKKKREVFLRVCFENLRLAPLPSSPCINYMQYPRGYALPVSHILSTCEDMQYPRGYAVPVSPRAK